MDYKTINDYEILYMIKEKDDYAQEVMYKKYLPIIKKLAAKYLNVVKNKGADFDDLVQEGYIGLSKAINSYRDDKNSLFYSYACLCIERRMNIYCRTLSSLKNEVLNNALFDEDVYTNCISNNVYNDPELSSIGKLREEEFKKYKNNLDIEDSSIFELRYNGFSYREIAELLDLSISTVDGRLSKIRRTLHYRSKNYV